jgi:hypothetical protein
VNKILFYIEKKAEEIKERDLFIYFLSFLYLRLILETALSYSLRIGGKMIFFESVRMLFIDHPVFFFNAFLLISFLISIFSNEEPYKILKIVLLFTPLILIPPIYDFIFHGGGARYYYLLEPDEVIKNLLKGDWIQYSLGFSRGQVIEVLSACFLSSLYLFLKNKKIRAILIFPLPFLFIVLIGSPYFLSLKFFGKNLFGDVGFLYYNQDKLLLYNLLIFILISTYFRKNKNFEISLNKNLYPFFVLAGFLTAWQKIDFHPLLFFDIVSLPLMIFALILKRKNFISYFISLSISISLGLSPFLILILYFLFEKTNLKILKEFLLSLFSFYIGASFFLKTRVHLSYPFYYPLSISLIYSIFSYLLPKYKIIPLFFLPFGFLLKTKTLFLNFEKNLLQEYEEKYEYTKDPSYLYDLWSMYMGIGEFEKVKEITYSLPFTFSPADYYGKRADFFLLIGEIDKAEKEAIKSINCGNPFSLLTLGHIYHIKGDERALKYLKKGHSMKLNPERSFFLLISEYLRQGKKEEAKKYLEDMKKWNKESIFYKILSTKIYY